MGEKKEAGTEAPTTETVAKVSNNTEFINNIVDFFHQKGLKPPTDWDLRFRSLIHRGWFDDLDEKITKPNFRFNINGVDCVPSGEVTAIAGKPGAGKSTALAILVGILIGRTEFAGIKCVTPCRKVLWLDTEKGPFSCQQKMTIFRQVADIDSNEKLEDCGVHFALLRQESTIDRLYDAYALAQKDNYDLIVIDGIFDFTVDPNKEYSSVTDLLRGLADNGVSVFAMLHTNKNNDHMRYALGTELERICTTRLTVVLEKKIHVIKMEKSNDTAMASDVSFNFDDAGRVVPVSSQEPSYDTDDKKISDLNGMMSKVFEECKEEALSHTSLVVKLMETFGISDSTAKRKIKQAKEAAILAHENNLYGLAPFKCHNPPPLRGG